MPINIFTIKILLINYTTLLHNYAYLHCLYLTITAIVFADARLRHSRSSATHDQVGHRPGSRGHDASGFNRLVRHVPRERRQPSQ